MGKKAKKKAPTPPTKEKLSQHPSEIAVKEKQACVHFDKGLNLDKVLEKIKSSGQIKCHECKEGVKGPKSKGAGGGKGKQHASSSSSDRKAIWVCLECGCYVCGGVGLPTGPQSHVLKHIRTTRHRLVIQWENPLLRWCFPCNSLLPVENKDVLLELVKLMKEPSLNNLAAPPSSDAESSVSGSIFSDIKLESAAVTSGVVARDGYVVRGLVNLGNTCFFNSIMQNLLSLDQLRSHFLKDDVSGVGLPLASSLRKLFAETKPEAGLKSVINPRAFFATFCAKAPQFRGYDQHDSHELLRCLLDSLSTEESAWRKRRCGVSDNDEKKSTTTLVDSVFGGETSSIVSCIECGHSSKVYEPFLDLSLPVPFKKTPPKKQQALSRAKKAKLPPKRVSKNVSKVNKVSKVLPTKALSEPSSPGKSVVATADSGTSCSAPTDDGAVSETPSVITLDNKQASESVDTDFDSFWLDVIAPETFGDETNIDMEDSVSDNTPTGEASQIVPCPNTPDNTSVSLGDQTSEGNTEKLIQDSDEFAKVETILDEKDVQATQPDEFRATSGTSAEITQDSCTGGDPSLGESSSSVNPWDEEDLPLVVADSQVLYMPYKENITAVEGEGEASSSSFVTGDQEPENNDFVGLGGLFDEPEVTEGPVFGPPCKAEASSGVVGFMAFSSESDPEEIDDSDSPVSVERCLAHFTKPEILSDDNAWNCENCSKNLKLQLLREKRKSSNGWVSENEDGVLGETDMKQDLSDSSSSVKDNGREGNDSESEVEEDSEKVITVKRDATKRVLLNKVPPVLTIHLKRFSQDLRGRLSKLNGHVAFKEVIDLGQYMDSRCSSGEDPPVYRLAGLVEHSGTMRGGHYVAYVRGASKKVDSSSSVWYNVSDAHVRQVSLDKVLHSEAYILFYERIV